MTQNNNSQNSNPQNGPDNASYFDDVDVPTYTPASEKAETMSFDSAGGSFNQEARSSHQPAFDAAGTASFAAPSSYTMPVTTPLAPAGPSSPTEIPADSAVDSQPTALEEKAAQRQAKLEERKADPRRGTLDLGLFFVRLALSVYLITAGLTALFGLGESQGLTGLESVFRDYAQPQVASILVPTLQLLAGAFLLLGLVTPFAAMVALVVTGFMALHELHVSGAGLDVFSWPEAVWLSVVLFFTSVALQYTGPGIISFDASRSWARRPLASSWIFVVVGAVALVAAWWFGAGINPL